MFLVIQPAKIRKPRKKGNACLPQINAPEIPVVIWQRWQNLFVILSHIKCTHTYLICDHVHHRCAGHTAWVLEGPEGQNHEGFQLGVQAPILQVHIFHMTEEMFKHQLCQRALWIREPASLWRHLWRQESTPWKYAFEMMKQFLKEFYVAVPCISIYQHLHVQKIITIHRWSTWPSN